MMVCDTGRMACRNLRCVRGRLPNVRFCGACGDGLFLLVTHFYVCTRISAMSREKHKLSDSVIDAIMGYTVIILVIACFLLGLAAVMTITRLVVGA